MVLLRLYIKVLLVILFSVSGCFAAEKNNNGSDQLDEQDQQEFNVRIDRANACTKSRDFACAEQQLAQAKKYVNGSRDRGVLKKAMENLELQRQLALRDDAKRKYSNERSTVEENAENTEKELAQSRRASVANADAEIRRADAAMERQHVKDKQSVSAYKAALWGNLQNNINRSWAQAEAGSRGSSIEEDRANAKRLSDFNDSISRMEADPNSDLNRDKRARERERAESKRADSERAAKREAAKRVVLADDAKRSADKRAEADAAANARKKQQADELKAQQEQEKQRLAAERRSQELRDIAERKRVTAAGEAKQKAEKEREQQAEKQARAQYLQSISAGIRLVATKCPDGEGKYYATGTRPRIKPEVVSCVDVRFRAYCPGSIQYSEGLAHNFIGMSGCFGDTYDISPKPGCKVDQVRIEVVEARECSN